jgi:hypothetical protein
VVVPAQPRSTYRGLYIVNWIYRYLTEKHYRQWVGESSSQWAADSSRRACPRFSSLQRVLDLSQLSARTCQETSGRGLAPLLGPAGGRIHTHVAAAPVRPPFTLRGPSPHPVNLSPPPIPGPVWVCGVVQTALYGDFFYYYYRAWSNNERLALPS